MPVTTGLDFTSKLTVPARSTIQRDANLRERIENDRTGDVVRRTFWDAAVAGDRRTIRDTATYFLASTSNAPTGFSRERLLLSGAAAHADWIEICNVADVLSWIDAVGECVGLMQTATGDFGLRREGSMDTPATRARQILRTLRQLVEELTMSGVARPWLVIRGLSFVGDFFVRDALVDALFGAGDGGWAIIVDAAYDRKLHNHPELSIEKFRGQLFASRLDYRPFAAGLNVTAAALRRLFALDAAEEMALLSIAYRPDHYSGNTATAVFENFGRNDLASASKRIANEFDNGADQVHLSGRAVELLGAAGRDDLVRLHLDAAPVASDWTSRALEILDAAERVRESIR